MRQFAAFWAVGVVVVGPTLIAWKLLGALGEVLGLFAVALFFTIVLAPAVDLVLVAVLIGVSLAGLLGALLAIPVAGALQVVVRDVWDERRGAIKEVLSTGADETPLESDA